MEIDIMERYAESKAKWARSEVGRESSRAASKRWWEKNRDKVRIHRLVAYAVLVGNIDRADVCEVCGSADRVDAHHDDYTKVFEVRWLCRGCHKAWHVEHEAVPPADSIQLGKEVFEHAGRKVPDADVEEMRRYREKGVSLRSLAQSYDVSISQVGRLLRGNRRS